MTSFEDPQEPGKPRTMREIIDGMPTPTGVAGTFALFLALEGEAIEQGRSTPEESTEVLRELFQPDQD